MHAYVETGARLVARRPAAPPRRHAVRAQRRRLPPRHLPRARRRRRGLPAVRGRARASASSSSATRSRRIAEIDPLRGKVLARPSRALIYPASHYVATAGDAARARSTASAASCSERLAELPRDEQAARGAAARAAHALRPRDARADGLLPRHRELLALARRPRGRRVALHALRLLPGRLPAGPRREPRHRARRSARCTAATARARRRWSSTASGCPRRSTTGRCASTSGSERAGQVIYVSATPGDYELDAVEGRGGRADHPPDRASSIRRSRCGPRPGRSTTCSARSARASRRASACSSRRSPSAWPRS